MRTTTVMFAVRRQLAREREVWGRLSKVIVKERVPAPVAGMFYQAIVAAVLLYGCESWILLSPRLVLWRAFMSSALGA